MARRKPRKGKAAKLAKKKQSHEPEELVRAPHSFVIHRGQVGRNVRELMQNFRKIMEPFTASHLRVQKRNSLKDFIHIAGPLNVTHLTIFTKSENAINLRIAKIPRGPTLTFQVKEYSLIRDIISTQKKSLIYEQLFLHHALLVLNNFSGEGMHFKLMATMFQNMFPSINVNKAKLNSIRRCVLLNYNSDDKTIDLRHYAIKVVPAGISKAVKKLVQNKVPNLSEYKCVDEFIQKSGNLSESEVEFETAANTVVLPQPISSRGNIVSEKSSVRLYEIGPRLKIQLIKIEEGLFSGDVLFHEFIVKTRKEIKALKAKIRAKKLLKDKRKAEQQRNVERKKMKLESDAKKEPEPDVEAEREREEDLQYYREEVGEEPDENLISFSKKRKSSFGGWKLAKKRKMQDSTPNKKTSENKEEKKMTFQEFMKKKKAKKEAKKKAKTKRKRVSQNVPAFRSKKHKETNIPKKKKFK